MFAALLDTNVLYPVYLRDTLLRLAEAELYLPLWSDDIFEELRRNLNNVMPDGLALRLIEVMNAAFPDSLVEGYEHLIEDQTCQDKDRHVLAAAIVGKAGVIVTNSTADFPEVSVKPYDIEIKSSDDFLLDQLELAPRRVLSSLQAQSDSYSRPEMDMFAVLNRLKPFAPNFVEEVRRRM